MQRIPLTTSQASGGLRFISRRKLLLTGGVVCVCNPGLAASKTLPMAVSLPNELAHALERNSPLLVMVSLDACPFCKVARENYLAPMRDQLGLHVVQVDMNSSRIVEDFRRATVTQDDLIRRWAVKIAPTVLFFGAGGEEIAERLVGITSSDFYGAYLDDRLRLARAAILRAR